MIDASGLTPLPLPMYVKDEQPDCVITLDKIASSKFSIVDESTVRGALFIERLERVIKDNRVEKLKEAFMKIFRESIVRREDR